MGVPPFRLEVITFIDGVDFHECFKDCVVTQIDDVKVNVISLEDLRTNKKASGRPKDINDLENLPLADSRRTTKEA